MRKKLSFDLIVPEDFSLEDVICMLSTACTYSIHAHTLNFAETWKESVEVQFKHLS